ncbi:MAG: paraquat-inducible protein A [Pseudomonadota bacterium]
MERAHQTQPVLTARAARLVGCQHCAKVWPLGTERCERCGGRLASRSPNSLQRVWAWWLAGLIAYVPANIEPMLVTRTLAGTQEATIVGGAVELFVYGSPGVAFVILMASVGIPVAKFLCIAYLAWSVGRRDPSLPGPRHMVYHVVEYIGRWSMIDVFVVAILSSLVQFSAVATISPGPASLAFALSVIFTMFSAQSFDSRLIWDNLEPAEPRR